MRIVKIMGLRCGFKEIGMADIGGSGNCCGRME